MARPFTRTDLDQRLQYATRVLDVITAQGATDRLWARIQDARRGFPSGHEPTATTVERDEDGNPTSAGISYSDRTGNLAVQGRDQVETDLELLADLTAMLDRATIGLLTLHQRYAQPHKAPRYCTSCRRDGGHHEPVATPRYSDACRFCGEWKAANGDWPPMEILRAHRRGQRITRQMLDRHTSRSGGKAVAPPR